MSNIFLKTLIQIKFRPHSGKAHQPMHKIWNTHIEMSEIIVFQKLVFS